MPLALTPVPFFRTWRLSNDRACPVGRGAPSGPTHLIPSADRLSLQTPSSGGGLHNLSCRPRGGHAIRGKPDRGLGPTLHPLNQTAASRIAPQTGPAEKWLVVHPLPDPDGGGSRPGRTALKASAASPATAHPSPERMTGTFPACRVSHWSPPFLFMDYGDMCVSTQIGLRLGWNGHHRGRCEGGQRGVVGRVPPVIFLSWVAPWHSFKPYN